MPISFASLCYCCCRSKLTKFIATALPRPGQRSTKSIKYIKECHTLKKLKVELLPRYSSIASAFKLFSLNSFQLKQMNADMISRQLDLNK